MHPQVALLQLLNPPLAGREGADLAAARMSNVVQALVHVATDRLPPYPNSRPEDYHGLQSYVDTLEEMKQGFIQGVRAFTPLEMEQVGRWPLAHPMYLDITLAQLGPLRPVPEPGDHRTPIKGLYISGAGTNPTGGIVGTPGRLAAQALLDDWHVKH